MSQVSLAPAILPLSGVPAQRPWTTSLTVEVWISLLFTLIWSTGVALGLPVNLPDADSWAFVQTHYFSPLLLACAIQVSLLYLTGKRAGNDPLLMLKLLPFVVLVIFLHFNFKAWMPLVNPYSYDEHYQRLDDWAWPLRDGFLSIRQAIADKVTVDMNHAYHGLFVALFFLSISLHAILDTPRRQRQLILGLCLILLLGGVGYWVAPAVGPFLYREGVNPLSTDAQHHMLAMFHQVSASGQLPPGYFTAPLAAMPSLHIAHALFLTLFAARMLRCLLLLYLPVFLWIVVASVASGWHYLIDLPMGAALSLACFWLAARLLPQSEAATEQAKLVPANVIASESPCFADAS